VQLAAVILAWPVGDMVRAVRGYRRQLQPSQDEGVLAVVSAALAATVPNVSTRALSC
jgi:hypothetical protein